MSPKKLRPCGLCPSQVGCTTTKGESPRITSTKTSPPRWWERGCFLWFALSRAFLKWKKRKEGGKKEVPSRTRKTSSKGAKAPARAESAACWGHVTKPRWLTGKTAAGRGRSRGRSREKSLRSWTGASCRAQANCGGRRSRVRRRKAGRRPSWPWRGGPLATCRRAAGARCAQPLGWAVRTAARTAARTARRAQVGSGRARPTMFPWDGWPFYGGSQAGKGA